MNESQSRLFNTILEAGFNGMEHIKMNKSIRIALLEKIIHYYRLHIDHFGELKSLKIFKSIFDE
jgi:DNA repair protein RecO (recombination protein O)